MYVATFHTPLYMYAQYDRPFKKVKIADLVVHCKLYFIDLIAG